MAAIDPTAAVQEVEGQKAPRATLKLIRETDDDDDEDDEDYDEHDFERIKAGLIGAGVLDDDDEDMSEDDDEDEDDSEDERNGGPSDPAKSKKAKVEALMKKLMENDDEMDVDDLTNGVNGTKSKGKARALDDEEISSDEDDDDEGEVEEFVLCTLDPEKVSLTPQSDARRHTDSILELSATPRYHCRRERDGLLPGDWYP